MIKTLQYFVGDSDKNMPKKTRIKFQPHFSFKLLKIAFAIKTKKLCTDFMMLF